MGVGKRQLGGGLGMVKESPGSPGSVAREAALGSHPVGGMGKDGVGKERVSESGSDREDEFETPDEEWKMRKDENRGDEAGRK